MLAQQQEAFIDAMVRAPAKQWASVALQVHHAYRLMRPNVPAFKKITGGCELPPYSVWQYMRKRIRAARRVENKLAREAAAEARREAKRDYMRAYMRTYRTTKSQEN